MTYSLSSSAHMASYTHTHSLLETHERRGENETDRMNENIHVYILCIVYLLKYMV